jgi:hypothetical protein
MKGVKNLLFIVSGALILLLFGSCRKDPEVLFFMDFEIPQQIGAGLNPIDAHFYNFIGVPTNFESLREAFNLDTNQRYVIEPHSAELFGIFNEAPYNFVRDVKIFLVPDLQPNSKLEIFSRENVLPNTGNRLIVFPWQMDLKKYLTRRDVQFLLQLNLRGASPTSIETRIRLRFQVRVL